jgi:fibronectin-binding autotransporter adhesin
VTTTGAQNYGGIVTIDTGLTLATSNADITFNNNVVLNGSLTLNAGSADINILGNISLGSGGVATQASYEATVLASNPLVFIPLTDSIGSSIASNLGTLGGNGTYTIQSSDGGPGRTTGMFSGSTALYVPGSSYLTYPNNASLNPGSGSFTMVAWVKNNSGGNGIILNKENQYEIAIQSNRIEWAIANSSPGWAWINANSYLPVTNTWTQIVFTSNGSAVNVYANGVAIQANYPVNGSISSGLNMGLMAGQRGNGGQSFDGGIANIAYYNSALSAATVLSQYQAAIGSAAPIANLNVNSGSFNVSGAITGVSTLNLNTSGSSSTLAGVISGAGGFTKTGTGTVVLSNHNTYTGTTAISAGTLNVTGTLSDSTAVTVASGATYIVGANDTVASIAGAGNVTLAANLTAGSTPDTTFSGVMSGTGNFTKAGTGTLTLSGANDYSGTTTVLAGTLLISHNTGLGTTAGGTTVNSGATLDLYNVIVGAEAVTLAGGTLKDVTSSLAGNITLTADSTLEAGSGDTLTLSGVISGDYGFTKTGTGTVVLSNHNTYTGTTAISAGTLNVTGTLSDSTAVTVASGATYIVGANDTVASIAGAGNVTLAANLTAGSTPDTTFSGVMSGTGNFTKAGTGTLTLSGANDYSGTTTVLAGTLLISHNTGLGTTAGGTTVNSGATLDLYNVIVGAEAVTLAGGTLKDVTSSLAGNITLTADSTLEAGSGDTLTLSGVISGDYGFTKTGTGTVVLSNHNTYTGTTAISAGTLNVTGTLSDSTAVTVASGATYIVGANDTVASIAGAGNVTLAANLTAGSTPDTTFSGVMSGTGNFTKAGTGTLTLSGANDYSGTTTISAGQTILSGAGTLGLTTNNLTLENAAVLDLQKSLIVANLVMTSANAITNSTGISTLTVGGTSSLAGTITTTGTQTYTGAVTLDAALTLTTTNGAVLFSSTIDNASATPRALTISTGSANVTLTGAVGSGANGALGAIIVNSTGATAFSSTVAAASVTTNAGGTVSLGNNVTTSGAQIYNEAMSLTGNVILNAPSITTASTIAAGSNNLTMTTDALSLASNITGTGALVIQPKTNSTTVAIGSSATGTLALSDTALTYINDAFSSITIGSATGTAAIGIDYAAASFTFTNPLVLRSNTGNIAAVDTLRTGTNGLTLSTGGTVNLVGVLSGALSVTGSAITLNNDITTSGSQSYTGPVALAANITLDSTASSSNGAVGFSSTVNSATSTARNLNVTAGSGNVSFTGAVGNTNALGAIAIDTTGTTTFSSTVNASSLTTNTGGTTSLGGNVTTTGAQTFNDAVVLADNIVLAASAITTANTVAAGNYNLTFIADAIALGAAVNGGTGTVTIKPRTATTSIGLGDASVGTLNLNNTELGYIDTASNHFASIVIGDAVNGTGAITYKPGSTISYGSNLTLQQKASGAGITLSNSITTTGTQTYTGAVTLDAALTLTTTNGAVLFSSTIDNASATPRALTISTGSANVTLTGAVGSGANGALGAIIVNSTGATAFSSTVAAASVTTNAGGTVSLGNNVTTSGAQIYNDAMSLTGNVVLNAPSITTASTIAAGSNNLTMTTDALSLASNITGTGALVIQPKTNSTTVAIGSSATGTLALSDTALTYINDAFSSITIGSATGTAAIGIDYAAASFTFTNPLVLRSNTGNIAAVDTLRTGTNGLTLSTGGTVNLVGVLSGALSVTGSAITLNNDITTSGSQSYTGPVALAANITLDSTASSSNGAVGFSSTVNSATSTARNLNVTAGSGNVSFTGAVGNTNALGAIAIDTTGTTTFSSTVNASSLTTNTGGTTSLGGNVTTTGAQTFNDAVFLTNAVTLTAPIIDFYRALTGNANSALTINASNAMNLRANITTAGNQLYNNDVTVAGDITMASTGGSITFMNKVLSQANQSYSLTVTAANLITITDSVGIAVTTTGATLPLTHALANLTVTAPNIRILGDVLTRNNQLFTGAVSIGDNGTKGALFEYYLSLLSLIDRLRIRLTLVDPIYARTFVSIDPSVTFAGTVDDVVKNTHSLFSAAITHLAPGDVGFVDPEIVFAKEIGKTNPLYSINLITRQNTNTDAYVGIIKLNGEVNTFSDQDYRSNTLTADPIAPLNTMTFSVDDANAKISFDLFKDLATNEFSLTNTDGAAELLFNGTTSFNGEETIPTFPTGKWNSVTVGLSLSGQEALKRSRAGGAELINVLQEKLTTAVLTQTTPLIPQLNRISQDHTNGGSIMAHIMNNNNFEIPKTAASGNVFVSMGGARSDKSTEVNRKEDLSDKNSLDDCTVDPAECEKR